MSHDHDVDIDQHVRTYMMVFGALLVLTIVTVAVSYIDLATPAAITVALIIATVKGSLVVCYFMHLIDEKKLIYGLMILAALFFFFELLIPLITESDTIHTVV